MYDYNNGRFLSVDPFIQDPGSTQSLNPYTYIFNNPLSGVDPTGYMSVNSGFQSFSGYCGQYTGCTGSSGDGKEDNNGIVTIPVYLVGDTYVSKSDIGSNGGVTKYGVCCDFAVVAEQPTPQERWDRLSFGQKLLSFFSPLVAMNEEESRAFINNSCGGECSTDFTEQELADFKERARQFGEFTERVIHKNKVIQFEIPEEQVMLCY